MKNYNRERQKVFSTMESLNPLSDEYKECLDVLERLNQIENKGLSLTNQNIVNSLTSLTSVLLILNYEKAGIIATKALSLIRFK